MRRGQFGRARRLLRTLSFLSSVLLPSGFTISELVGCARTLSALDGQKHVAGHSVSQWRPPFSPRQCALIKGLEHWFGEFEVLLWPCPSCSLSSRRRWLQPCAAKPPLSTISHLGKSEFVRPFCPIWPQSRNRLRLPRGGLVLQGNSSQVHGVNRPLKKMVGARGFEIAPTLLVLRPEGSPGYALEETQANRKSKPRVREQMRPPWFAENVSRFRNARGMTSPTQLGSAIKVMQQLQKYETGMNRLSAGILMDVSKLLDCFLTRVCSRTGVPNRIRSRSRRHNPVRMCPSICEPDESPAKNFATDGPDISKSSRQPPEMIRRESRKRWFSQRRGCLADVLNNVQRSRVWK